MIEIDLNYSPIPSGCLRRFIEVTFKKDGHIWRIHKNDPDPFPSNPHAHNVESGLKLNLSTGELFYGARPSGGAVSRKDLIALRNLASAKGVEMPPLLV